MPTPTQPERALYSRPNTDGQLRWYVRMSVQGREQRFAPHGGFPTYDEAQTFLKDARARLRLNQFFPEHYKSIALPLADLLVDPDPVDGPTHPDAKNERAYRAWWRTFAGHHDAKRLPDTLLVDARRALAQKGLSPQTVHHYLKFLRHILNVAKRAKRIEDSPFDHAPLKPVHNVRERFYALDEQRWLLQALGLIWREAEELAGLTGLRWSEQFQLERAHVHLDAGYVALPMTKAGGAQATPAGSIPTRPGPARSTMRTSGSASGSRPVRPPASRMLTGTTGGIPSRPISR